MPAVRDVFFLQARHLKTAVKTLVAEIERQILPDNHWVLPDQTTFRVAALAQRPLSGYAEQAIHELFIQQPPFIATQYAGRAWFDPDSPC